MKVIPWSPVLTLVDIFCSTGKFKDYIKIYIYKLNSYEICNIKKISNQHVHVMYLVAASLALEVVPGPSP